MNQSRPVPNNGDQMASANGSSTNQQQLHSQTTTNTTNPKKTTKQVPGIKGLSVSMMVLSVLIGVFGIIAILIEGRLSYVGDPVWTGLGLNLVTIILGLSVYYKGCNRCLNIAFIVMTIISSIFLLQLIAVSIISALGERRTCNPHFDYDSYWWDDSDGPCRYPDYARIIVDLVITLLASASLVLCVIAGSLTTYATFKCCQTCCRRDSPSSAGYMPYTTVMMLPMDAQNNQGQMMFHNAAPGQSTSANTYVLAGSSAQPGTGQPLVIAASPAHQSSVVQPIVVAGANGQPVVIAAGTPPTQPVATANLVSSGGADSQVGMPSVQQAAAAAAAGDSKIVQQTQASSQPNLGTQANVVNQGQVASQPQNWEKF